MWRTRLIISLMALLIAWPASANVIKIGVLAPEGFAEGMRRWQPSADYLSQHIPEHVFQMLPYSNLDELQQDAVRGKFDFLITHPASFLLLEQQVGLTRLLTWRDRDGSQVGIVLFTRADSPAQHIRDLRGSRFVSTTEQDFTGGQLARLELMQHQLDSNKDFARFDYAGDSLAVLRGVMEGDYSAGAMSAADLAGYIRQGIITPQAVRILEARQDSAYPHVYSNTLYPHWPLGARTSMPLELRERVAAALLEMPSGHPALRAGQYTGWVQALDYRPVRQLLRETDSTGLARQVASQQWQLAGLNLQQHESWLLIALALSLLSLLLVRRLRQRNPLAA